MTFSQPAHSASEESYPDANTPVVALIAPRPRHSQPDNESSRIHARGKVVAMLSVKGGAGATVIATNLAHAISTEGRRVCLIDLNLQFGEASLYVSESSPSATVADVVRCIERLDGTLLEANMLRIAPNYWLLAAPESPETAIDIRARHIERILTVAREHFDFVILDISRAFDANSIMALDCADHIYLVLQKTLPYLRDCARLLKLFQSLSYPAACVHLLVNRHEKGGDIGLREVERSLHKEVATTLPNSFNAVAAAINLGRPVLDLAPRDPFSKALRELANELIEQLNDKSMQQVLKRRA